MLADLAVELIQMVRDGDKTRLTELVVRAGVPQRPLRQLRSTLADIPARRPQWVEADAHLNVPNGWKADIGSRRNSRPPWQALGHTSEHLVALCRLHLTPGHVGCALLRLMRSSATAA